MRFSQAEAVLANLPYTGSRKGKFFYDFVKQNGIEHVLELGFAHGVSTCYLAAAMERGHIDTVDILPSATFDPTIESLVDRLGLREKVSIYRETSSYTWFLKKKIEEQTHEGACVPLYDLVFIDGPKDWTNDGAAFFMADKLLKPGGWLILDDYDWTYRGHEKLTGAKHPHGYVFANMSEDEFAQSHVEAIFRLLVQQRPDYSDFQVVDDTLAIARKSPAAGKQSVRLGTSLGASYMLFKALKTVNRFRIKRRKRTRKKKQWTSHTDSLGADR